MPRRREVPKREIIPDPRYGDRQVAKFCNVLMYDGKKSTVERIVYGAFDLIEDRLKEDPLKGIHPRRSHRRVNVVPHRDPVTGEDASQPLQLPCRGVELRPAWVEGVYGGSGSKTNVEPRIRIRRAEVRRVKVARDSRYSRVLVPQRVIDPTVDLSLIHI